MAEQAKPTKRRGHHEGTFRVRPNGTHECRFTLPDGRRMSVYGKSRAEVREKMKGALGKAERGIDLRAEKQTVATFLRGWLEDVARPKLRPSTLQTYRSYVERHIVPALGPMPLGQLSARDVQAFLNDRSAAGLSPRTVQQIRAILRSALSQAEAWGWVDRNVARHAKPPRIVRSEARALSAAQARALVAHTGQDRLGPLFAVALHTGLRQGELLGLRWPDLDLDARTLAVRQAAQKVDRVRRERGETTARWEFVEPKSVNSRRTVKLPPAAVAALREQRERVRRMRREAGDAWEEWGLVFPSAVGTPLDGSNVTHHLKRCLAAAGLPVVCFHALRHTTATLLLEQGVPARVVMEQLGHSQISLTLGTYSHVAPALLDDAADALSRALGG